MRKVLLSFALATSLCCLVAVPIMAQEADAQEGAAAQGARSQRGRITDLESQSAALKKEVEALKARLAKLELEVKKLTASAAK